jgi:hypothetical protein
MNIPQIYEAVTTALADETGASDTLLHVHAGMAVLLAVRVISGRSLATPIPFAAVVVAALLNEVADRINHGAWRWHNTGWDIVNTVFWPLVLMVGLRVRRSREWRRSAQLPH